MSQARSTIVYTYITIVIAVSSSVWGFAPLTKTSVISSTALRMVAVDPTTVTKKEYEDICGISFDGDTLQQRLKSTKYLWPKHVEVIEDIAPIAGQMVDDVVRVCVCVCACVSFFLNSFLSFLCSFVSFFVREFSS
jgi:hypothetical protein